MSKRGRITGLVCAGVLGCAVLISIAVGLLFDLYVVPSEANAPTLNPGDRILVRPVDGDAVTGGDLVIYVAPDEVAAEPLERIARVVAVAGDSVDTDDGVVT